jgi:hypothetical protein
VNTLCNNDVSHVNDDRHATSINPPSVSRGLLVSATSPSDPRNNSMCHSWSLYKRQTRINELSRNNVKFEYSSQGGFDAVSREKNVDYIKSVKFPQSPSVCTHFLEHSADSTRLTTSRRQSKMSAVIIANNIEVDANNGSPTNCNFAGIPCEGRTVSFVKHENVKLTKTRS